MALRSTPGSPGPPSPEPSLNPRLAAALEKARVIGYPRGNVESVMKRASVFISRLTVIHK